VVIALALAAAVSYAAAMVLQQHEAGTADQASSLRPSLVVALARRPLWLGGVVANLLGYGLRFAALGRGSLVVVQPLLVTSLLFALPWSAAWHRRGRLGRGEWASAVAIVAGLAMFLTAAGSSHNGSDPSGAAWAGAAAACGAVAGAVVLAGRGSSGSRRAAYLAAAGGVLLALTAALTKAVATGLRHDGLSVALRWTPWALLAVGLLSVVVVQSAFGAAPLSASLPVLMVVEPLASLALGMALFGEHVAGGPVARGFEVVGLVLAGFGVVVLARSEAAVEGPVEVVQ
jgi:drug/metabolite transporter (DMT)-like permease